MAAASRTTFLIDGFNLYHSLCDASDDLGKVTTKWFNIRSACASYLAQIGGGATLQDVFYFSAFASYRLAVDGDVTNRHRKYIECLRDTGVHVELAKFKSKQRRCPLCKGFPTFHEEKETDVAIGVKLMEVFFRDLCDVAVIVTGDSDLAPAIRSAKALFPKKRLCLLSPYKRVSFELRTLVHRTFLMKTDTYTLNQFPNPYPHSDGTPRVRPARW